MCIRDSKYTIDGTVYELSANKAEIDETVSPKNDVDFYLDSYGYIVKLDEAEGEVSVDNLAYVIDADKDRGSDWAKLLFANGKTKVVDVTKSAKDAKMVGTIVSFKVEDDGLSLIHISLMVPSYFLLCNPSRKTGKILSNT